MAGYPINQNELSIISLEIYADEILKTKCRLDDSYWVYIGILLVPLDKKQKLLQVLNNLRCIKHNNWNKVKSDCQFKCDYHKKNNTEIHYNRFISNFLDLKLPKDG